MAKRSMVDLKVGVRDFETGILLGVLPGVFTVPQFTFAVVSSEGMLLPRGLGERGVVGAV
jgi:hypothetical protein